MNTVTFVVGLDRGQFIQKEVESFPGRKDNWKFEIVDECWLQVQIKDMSSMDALMIFHAGCDAGTEQSITAIRNKS